jgi:transcriptional antiterminator NusG
MMYGDMGISEELDEERFEVDEGDKAWYVIQTLSGQEKKVKDMLERLKEERFKDIIFDVKFPMMEGYELKEGRKKRIRKKFFPGYIMVYMKRFDESEESKKLVREIHKLPGIGRFLNINPDTGIPKPMRDEEANELFKRIDEIQMKERLKPKVDFVVGEHVRVIDGPFINFTGVIEQIDEERGKVRVSVEIFNRTTSIELSFSQIGKV